MSQSPYAESAKSAEIAEKKDTNLIWILVFSAFRCALCVLRVVAFLVHKRNGPLSVADNWQRTKLQRATDN